MNDDLEMKIGPVPPQILDNLREVRFFISAQGQQVQVLIDTFDNDPVAVKVSSQLKKASGIVVPTGSIPFDQNGRG